MALLKKVNSEWFPSEKKDLKVGETIEITDYTNLVKTGVAVLVDGSGKELSMPGTSLKCPVCFKEELNIDSFMAHLETHKQVVPAVIVNVSTPKAPEELVKAGVPPSEVVRVEAAVEEPATIEKTFKERQLENLAKARATRALKKGL